jgi:hypothetical protein
MVAVMPRARNSLISLSETPYYHCAAYHAVYAVLSYVVKISLQAKVMSIVANGLKIEFTTLLKYFPLMYVPMQ